MDGSTGKAVIVTGAGSGIGRETARAFAASGARVLAVGRTGGKLRETARGRSSILSMSVDITEEGAAEHIVATAADELGGVDVLINNASVLRPSKLGSITPQDFDRLMAVNVRSPLLLVQAALSLLEESQGTVVNISAAVGSRGWPGFSLYGSSKAALDFCTRTWGSELAARGIRVASVAPGPVETPILSNNGLTDTDVSEVHRLHDSLPMGRAASPEEITWWILNLAKSKAAYVTGAIFPVDGGYTAT